MIIKQKLATPKPYQLRRRTDDQQQKLTKSYQKVFTNCPKLGYNANKLSNEIFV